jgi:hypothetical protein
MGTEGTLTVDGVGFPLPFTVRSCEYDELHVAFRVEGQAAAALAMVVQRLAGQSAAA